MNVAKDVAKRLQSPVARWVLDFSLGSVWKVGFARSLGLNERVRIMSLHPLGKSLEAIYTVPQDICITGGTSGGGADSFLSCGVTTAIFDEISSLCMMLADRNFRPGVSISLSCQMFHPVSPGESVTFKCRALKMGARIGFGEASMYREDGKLAAKGRHVKYLPMGRMWDLSMQPFLFPLVRKLSHLQHDQMLKDLERTKAIPAGGNLLDMFELEGFELLEEREGVEKNSDDANPGSALGWESEKEFRIAEAEVSVTKRHLNYIPGVCHGGAIAVAAEVMARRCPPSYFPLNEMISGNPSIKFMEVHYMSAIKRRAGLAAASGDASTGTGVTRVGLSEAGGEGGGPLCAEAVLWWGRRE